MVESWCIVFIDKVIDTVKNYLAIYCNEPVVRISSCSDQYLYRLSREGVYIFLDKSSDTVYYVGETSNISERVAKTHCKARIGSSEGIVRFLVFLLPKLCSDREILAINNIPARERLVRRRIKDFLEKLVIIIGYCNSKKLGKEELIGIEDNLRKSLNPLLNPKITSTGVEGRY
jgi:hypothetical protein